MPIGVLSSYVGLFYTHENNTRIIKLILFTYLIFKI